MDCPLCGMHGVGKIGRERYYCPECCHEWTVKSGEIKLFKISPDGTVARLKVEYRTRIPRIGHTLAAGT